MGCASETQVCAGLTSSSSQESDGHTQRLQAMASAAKSSDLTTMLSTMQAMNVTPEKWLLPWSGGDLSAPGPTVTPSLAAPDLRSKRMPSPRVMSAMNSSRVAIVPLLPGFGAAGGKRCQVPHGRFRRRGTKEQEQRPGDEVRRVRFEYSVCLLK